MTATPRASLAALAAGLLLMACAPALRADEGDAPPLEAAPETARPRHRLADLPTDVQRVLCKMDEAGAEVESLTARVTYERAIPLLEERAKARGKLAFRKPASIAIELGRPRNEDVYSDGRTWWVVSHDEKQVEVYQAAGEQEGAASEAAFLQFGYGTGAEELLQDYEIELTDVEPPEQEDGETLYRLKLIPRARPDRPARYAAVEVEVGDELWLPRRIVLHESDGEIVHSYALSSVRTNAALDEGRFVYEPPRGYNVVRVE